MAKVYADLDLDDKILACEAMSSVVMVKYRVQRLDELVDSYELDNVVPDTLLSDGLRMLAKIDHIRLYANKVVNQLDEAERLCRNLEILMCGWYSGDKD